MKKILIAALVFGFGLAYAATIPVGSGPSVISSTVLSTLTPDYTGQLVVCSDCPTMNGGKGTVCISSGTASGAWIVAGSSLTAVTACR